MNNKQLLKPLIMLFFLVTLSFCNCKKKVNCGEPNLIDEKSFSFRLVDQNSGESLIALWGAIYESDKVSLVKEDGLPPRLLLILEDGNISFPIEDSSSPPLDELIKKNYYLKLPDLQGVPERDIDTLRFEYKLYSSDCNIQYDFLKAYYNDSLQYSGEYSQYIEFTKH